MNTTQTPSELEQMVQHLLIVVPQRFHADEQGNMTGDTFVALDALSWKEWKFIKGVLTDAVRRQASHAALVEALTTLSTLGGGRSEGNCIAQEALRKVLT